VIRFTLDSNVLVYAAQRGDERHATAAAVLRRAVRGDCVQTLQSLGECFNALVRKRGFSKREARHIVQSYRDLFKVVTAAEVDDLGEAMRAAAAYGFQYWDGLLWATARRVGCSMILTEDLQDGRDLDGVMFVSPFKPENKRLVDLALPPSKA
jgi:predicted nucleic acid-binding protein